MDGEKREIRVEETDLEDGRQLKYTMPVSSVARSKIKVKWKIDHLLTFYKDIAELNWFPISDGDEKVAKLDFFMWMAWMLSRENCMPILVTLIHQPKSNGLKLVIIFGQRIFQKWKARTACLLANDRSPASRPSK